MSLYDSYIETATFDKIAIGKNNNFSELVSESFKVYETLKMLRNSDLLKKVCCVRIYESSGKQVYQIGPI